MAKRPKPGPALRHVKYVRVKGQLYAYFNTGAKNDKGNPIYRRLPHPGSVGFYDSYAAMVAGRTRRAAQLYTLADLARDYEDSAEFRRKAANTQKTYRLTLAKITGLLGAFPVNDLQRADVVLALGTIKGAGTHNLFLAVLGTLYRHARKAGKTTMKPTADIDKLETGEHMAWPESLVELGLNAQHDRTRLAIHLLYFTGQRIGDVAAMRWSDIKDGQIHVTQQKTGKALRIRLSDELRTELDRTPKRGMTILTGQNGKPINDAAIRKDLKTFGAAHGHQVVPHGLRKNAVISLLEAGCTVAETAAITGQTYDVVEYYARQVDQSRLGSAAILKLENKRGRGKPIGKLTS